MTSYSLSSLHSRLGRIAAQRNVHEAFRWIHLNQQLIMNWQLALVSIPAPPFGEEARAQRMVELFRSAGLTHIHRDTIGNVIGTLAATQTEDTASIQQALGGCLMVSAHLDTVFPLCTELDPVLDGHLLTAPGACDNGAGLVGLLALINAITQSGIYLPCDLVFVANVGEEGEGDLRGIRHIYEQSALARRVTAHLVLDGAGHQTAVSYALGSRRFSVAITGPGGHSFSDAGTPNPIVTLSTALYRLAQIELPSDPRTTLNIGTIEGGTSVNSIPQRATASIDLRSTDMSQLVRLEVEVHRAVEDAVIAANLARGRAANANRGVLRFSVEKIGDRPTGALAETAPLIQALRSVDRHLGIRTELRLGSTDANIPLSLGVPALSLGAGGEGGATHTTAEWYDGTHREHGIKRLLLLLLLLAESPPLDDSALEP